MQDLFQTPKLIPAEIQAIFDTFDENADGYQELPRILSMVEALGYTFDWYLDCEPYDLHKIN